jgi:hypothetical protein
MMTSNAAVPEEGIGMSEPLRPDILDTSNKVHWGSIIAGLVVALGAWLILTVLGLALGLSQAEPGDAGSLKTAGMVTGIWSLIVPIVALLAGGLVAARTAGVLSRPTGALHGVVLWALVMIASLALVGYVVKGVVGTAMSAGGGLANAASSAVSGGAPGDVGRTLGINADDLLGPVNQRLRAEGKPPVTSQQLDATMKDISATAVRQGNLDRGVIVAAVTRNTRLSQADAQDLSTRIEMQVNQQKNQIGQDLQNTATKAADTTGKAMWWAFFGMLLGLGAAVIGSTLGVSRSQRLVVTPSRRVPIVTHEHAHST